MRLIFAEVNKRAGDGGKRSWILKSVMDEILDTLTDELEEDEFARWLLFAADLMHWVATGDENDIPDELKEHVAALLSAQHGLPELPAGDSMSAH